MLQIQLKIFTPTYKSGRRFYSVLAKQSMFKCLTHLAQKKSGNTGIIDFTLLVSKQIWAICHLKIKLNL